MKQGTVTEAESETYYHMSNLSAHLGKTGTIMQNNLEELKLLAPSLPLQNLPTEERTTPPISGSLLPSGNRPKRQSKEAFRRAQVLLLRTGAYGSMGVALCTMMLISLFVLLAAGIQTWEHFHPTYETQFNLPGWQIVWNITLLVGPFALGAGVVGSCGWKANKWAARLAADLPVQSAADIPAADSLLRGSAEPVQEQQKVLLRAAGQGPEMPPEELLRATTGKGIAE